MITLSTDPIELTVSAGVPVTIAHGLGRQVAGWLVIWQTAAVAFTAAMEQDSSRELVLLPNASAIVRLVLL